MDAENGVGSVNNMPMVEGDVMEVGDVTYCDVDGPATGDESDDAGERGLVGIRGSGRILDDAMDDA